MLLQELSAYRQWVICRADKIPLRVSDGERASSTNPEDWTDYATASSFCSSNVGYLLGFVLSSTDPYSVVDLDTYKADSETFRDKSEQIKANHAEIFRAFDTYTEVSPSGGGAHIWCKGNVQSRKFSEQCLEVYSSERFFTVTFNAVNNKPVEYRQQLLEELVKSIDIATERKQNVTSTIDLAEILTDEEIIKKAAQAANGELFKQLYQGQWQGLFPSQSEADLTLCNLIAFYTDNRKQVGRIFRSSALGQRKKAQRDAFLYHKDWGIVTKAFDQKGTPIDIEGLTKEWEQKKASTLDPISDIEIEQEYKPDSLALAAEKWQRPTGLLGDIAEYIYQSAVLPNIEVALAGAITFMAGICGRSYNTITGTGLNQYIVLLAGTGQGKEGAARGMSRLYKAVLKQVPGISQFAGPSEIASSQALLKYFADSNCFWSHKNEFGFWLQKLNSKYAKANELTLKGMLLDLFHKSGKDDVLMGSIYSDKKNNAPMVKAPSLTLYGESTPEEFYKAVDEANIAEGLISRLTLIPVPDVRPPYNPDAGLYAPPDGLVWRISGLVKRVLEVDQTQTVVCVPETPEANEYQLKYQKLCMDRVWVNREDIIAKIWQRAHIRLLRLGALIAVGNDCDNPCVTLEDYKWAKKLIDYGALALKARFESGEVGETNFAIEQSRDLKRFLIAYSKKDWSDKFAKSYRITFDMWKVKAIPYATIYKGLGAYASFRKDRNPSSALYNVLREFEQAGYIVKCDIATVQGFGKRGNVYCVTGDIE